jgi:lactate permease
MNLSELSLKRPIFAIVCSIVIIIFGAIFFLEVLKELKIIKNISYYLSGFSKDYRIQIIIIAWFFECFIELVIFD